MMKKFMWIAALFASFALLVTACGGGDTDDPPPATKKYWTVTFDLNGGGDAITKKVQRGKAIAKPSNPTHNDSAFTFVNWYESTAAAEAQTADTEFDFTTKITANKTLYAGWDVDTTSNWVVKFYNDAALVKEIAVSKTGDKKIPTASVPSTAPYTGANFLGWFEENADTAFNFAATELSDDLNLYAKFVTPASFADIFPQATGNPVGSLVGEDLYLSLVKQSDGKSAIRIVRDANDGGGCFRMQFKFTNGIDISQYGNVNLYFNQDPSGTRAINITLIVGEDADHTEWVGLYGPEGDGFIDEALGSKLHFKSKMLWGWELWSAAPEAVSPIFVTKLEFTGEAVPEPEGGEEIDLTENAYISFWEGNETGGIVNKGLSAVLTANKTQNEAGDYIIDRYDSGTNENGPYEDWYKKVYINFPAQNKDFTTIRIEFAYYGSDTGGNIMYYGVVDKNGLNDNFGGSSNYINWFGGSDDPSGWGWSSAGSGNNPGIIRFDPVSMFPTVDKESMTAVVLEVGASAATFHLESVIVYVGEGEPVEPIVILGATNTTGLSVTGGTLAGSTITVTTSGSEVRCLISWDTLDLTGYTKLKFTWSVTTAPEDNGTAKFNITPQGGSGMWGPWAAYPEAEINCASNVGAAITGLEFYSGSPADFAGLTITAISFE